MPARNLQQNQLIDITLNEEDAWILRADYLNSIDELLLYLPSLESGTNDIGIGARHHGEATENIPRLLVCHDFKGGYTEDPFERGYSFEFWHLVDTFVFSHNRVTIPPRGWIEAAHRSGVKILGTLIFEWEESKSDLGKCLYQGTPVLSDGQPSFAVDSAAKLIQLAQEHDLDGYLLNIETDLNFLPPEEYYPDGKDEREKDEEALLDEKTLCGMKTVLTSGLRETRANRMQKNAMALEHWTVYIRNEGKRLVGPHFEIIWYDSVTTEGKLQWQDALTSLNAPFFMAADRIFTNYTWASPPPPSPPGNFELIPEIKYHPKLLQSSENAKTLGRLSSDVFVGIDVFGRNCYGGFDISKSLDMIFSTDLPPLELSVAIFAPGWTWERAKEDGTERSWSEWWDDDLHLWVMSRNQDSSSGYLPVGAYFGPRQCSRTRGNQTNVYRPFYTNFSRGSGNAWWMYGKKVYDGSQPDDQLGRLGWTDIGASFPLPDRLWPQIRTLCLSTNESKEFHLIDTTASLNNGWTIGDAALDESDAWQASACLNFALIPDTISNNTSVPFLIVPICTLQASNVTTEDILITIMVKVSDASAWEFLTISPRILWANDKPHNTCSYTLAGISRTLSRSHLTRGWYQVQAVVTIHAHPDPTDLSFVTPVVGLQISSTAPTTQQNPPVKCLIGSITASSVEPERQISSAQPGIAYWKPLDGPNGSSSPALWGILTWDKEEKHRDSCYFDIIVSINPDLDIVAIRNTDDSEDVCLWLGSSTAGKRWNSFVVCGLDPIQVPNYDITTTTLTFYVVHVSPRAEIPLYKLTTEVLRR